MKHQISLVVSNYSIEAIKNAYDAISTRGMRNAVNEVKKPTWLCVVKADDKLVVSIDGAVVDGVINAVMKHSNTIGVVMNAAETANLVTSAALDLYNAVIKTQKPGLLALSKDLKKVFM